MRNDPPSPAPVWLCAALLASGGFLCLWFAAVLPVVCGGDDDPFAVDLLTTPGAIWATAGCLGVAGILQLALACRGVWVRRSAEGAS